MYFFDLFNQNLMLFQLWAPSHTQLTIYRSGCRKIGDTNAHNILGSILIKCLSLGFVKSLARDNTILFSKELAITEQKQQKL